LAAAGSDFAALRHGDRLVALQPVHKVRTMKKKLKLWLRKQALKTLRAVLWRADEWLHAAELRLRHDLAATAVQGLGPVQQKRLASGGDSGASRIQTFAQWKALRGATPVPVSRRGRKAAR
jgi:hypothetical protein